jgi:hypothetical protein
MDPRRRLPQHASVWLEKRHDRRDKDGRIGQVVLWLQLAIEDRRSVTIIDEARAKRMLRNERFMEAENAKTR